MHARGAQAGTGSFEVDVFETDYVCHDGKRYRARVFQPRGEGPFPAVVDAHGGAWIQGTYVNNDPINRPVAEGGVVVVSIDYRLPPDATYPGSVADVNYAVRWIKLNERRFKTRAGLVGTMGTSSGGHLAVLAALKPMDPRYCAVPLPGGEHIGARVPYVVTLWPVICPYGRFIDVKERRAKGEEHYPTRVGAGDEQMNYWLTEEAMADGSPTLALERGERVELPDILYVQALGDRLHPREILDRFVANYRKAGGRVDVEWVEGEPYDLVRSKPESASAKLAIRRIIDFIRHQAELAGTRAKAGA